MNTDTKKITSIAMFTCLIIILQIMATFINFSGFPITLTLVPIIVGGAIYGIKTGAFLGTVFGIIVAIMVISGADPSGASLLAIHPFITIMACILKGTLAGYFAAFLFKLLAKKNSLLAIIVASAICPIINTLCLALTIILFFDGAFVTLISLFVAINFIIELLIDILLAPALLRIIVRKK